MAMRRREVRGRERGPIRQPMTGRRWVAGIVLAFLPVALVPAVVAAAQGSSPAAEAPVAPASTLPFLGGFITESRVLYPLRLGDWQAQDEHRYDDPAYGVSVRYRDEKHPQRWLDVYFWPAGKLPPEALRAVIDGTARELAGMAGRPDYYDDIRVGAPEALELQHGDAAKAAGKAATPAWLLPLQSTRQGQQYLSELGLFVRDMYFVKLRYSAPAADVSAAALRGESTALLQALERQVGIINTGACWGLLPMVDKAAPDARAPGALMNSAVEGRVTAVAFADRVEARDPADASARLLQVMASLQTGRLADPSCVAPERINPQVEEGQREIRMEYRVPTAAPEAGPRLRVPLRRTG